MGSFQYRKQQLHPTSHQRTPLVALQAIDLGATQPPPSTAAATTYVSPSDTQIATRRQATLYDGLTDNDQNSVQNGGIQGFLKVFGCFCVFFITLGMASTFGSYQAYYESGPLQSYSPSAISWIGTTQVFLLSFMGLFSGIFYDRGYTRSVLALGMTLIVLGLMTLSLTQAFWQILLTQGICVGFGSGLVYVPAVSVVSSHFTSKRAVALGIAATGSAVGGVVLPIAFRKLLPSIGFGWTNRVLAILTLVLAIPSFFILTDFPWPSLRPERIQRRRSEHNEEQNQTQTTRASHEKGLGKYRQMLNTLTAHHGKAYLFLCAGVFFVFLGYWVPLFYIVPFASGSLDTTSAYATYLLSILNAGSFFGRVLPAYMGQLIGSAVVLFAGAVSLSLIVFTWLAVSNTPGITVWCVFVGFFSGIVVSIPNAVASRLSIPSNVGLRIGFMWTVGAFAELIGAPIAGVLVRQKHLDGETTSYIGAQVFGGASIALGAALLLVPAWSIFRDDRLKNA